MGSAWQQQAHGCCRRFAELQVVDFESTSTILIAGLGECATSRSMRHPPPRPTMVRRRRGLAKASQRYQYRDRAGAAVEPLNDDRAHADDLFLVQLDMREIGIVQNVFSPVHIRRQFVHATIDKIRAARCHYLWNTGLAGRL